MTELLTIVLPVFALIGLGAGAAKLGLINPLVGDALGRFAFLLALPALLFRTLVSANLPAGAPWGYWASYFGAMALIWPAGQFLARRVFGLPPGDAVIAGLAVAQANTVMVGIPLIVKAYGEAGAVPIALLMGVNLPITMTVATVFVEAAREGDLRQKARGLARNLATHPILIAIVAGMGGGLAGLTLPPALDTTLALLAQAAVPCALVALGTSLIRFSLRRDLPVAAFVSAGKLLAMPGLVYLFGRFAGLEPLYLGAAVIFASAPVGVNVYVFASRYQTGVDMSSGAITLSTIAALATTTFWLWAVGIG